MTTPLPSLSSAPAALASTGRSAVAGVVATGAALGVSELLAGLLPGATSLVAAIGQLVIDAQPAGAKEIVVGLFGSNDKLAFELFIVAVALLIGAGLGVLARRSFGTAALVFAGFGVVGFVAALRDPTASPAITAAAAAVSVGVGLWVLDRLVHPVDAATIAAGGMPDWSRRAFVLRAGAIGVASIAAGVVGRTLLERQRVTPDTATTPIPPASEVVAPLGPDMDLSTTVAGLTPIVVPNEDFYRIDINLLVPSVETEGWTLRIHGLVERETTLTWAELLELPLFEQYVTIACVSNEVGGDLVGNTKWTGVRLRDVLDLAGVRPEADQLVGHSVDDFTAGMPVAWVMDPAREPMIAVLMDDEPLPRAHGFPARLIVPGLYGYVSATKWLTELELTTFESFAGYWITRGWARDAPVLTQSRIDRPTGGGVAAGRVPIAGIAWAPDRGVSRVEVGIDGAWQDARLSRPISDATWVQWVLDWDADPGDHLIQVRATDGGGEVQPEARTPPAPDGARGWDQVRVTVS